MLPLHIGSDLDEATCTQQELEGVLSLYQGEQYLLTAHSARTTSDNSIEIHLLFKRDVTKRDMVKKVCITHSSCAACFLRGFHLSINCTEAAAEAGALKGQEVEVEVNSWEEEALRECYALTQEAEAGENSPTIC